MFKPLKRLPGFAIFALLLALVAPPALLVAVRPDATGFGPFLGKLCSLTALGFLGAALAHFLHFAQEKGEIFRFWRSWTFRQLWFKGRARLVGPFGFEPTPYSNWIYKASGAYYRTRPTWRQALYKILGGCIYCSSVWVGSFFYWTGAANLAAPFWLTAWGWPLFVGAQFVFIDLLFLIQPKPAK